MAAKHIISVQSRSGDEMVFDVRVGQAEDQTHHVVTIDSSYWNQISDAYESPEEMVVKAFEFLLEREPKESILREFNIQLITHYFPEYEDFHHSHKRKETSG